MSMITIKTITIQDRHTKSIIASMIIIMCAFIQGIQRSLGELYTALKAQTHDQKSVKVSFFLVN